MTNNTAKFYQLSETQQFNEALIKMTVLLYQVDGKVTLSELDYFDQLVANITWDSPIGLDGFVQDAIHQARFHVDNGNALGMLKQLVPALALNATEANNVAYEITGIDGERSVEEQELLHYLTYKALARYLIVDQAS